MTLQDAAPPPKRMLWVMGALMDLAAWGYVSGVGKQAISPRGVAEFDQLYAMGCRPDMSEIRAVLYALEVPRVEIAARALDEYKYRNLPEQQDDWQPKETAS